MSALPSPGSQPQTVPPPYPHHRAEPGGAVAKIQRLTPLNRFGQAFAVRRKSEGGYRNMKSGNERPAPEPPGHLSERSQALWRELVRYRCDSAERRLLLECALTDLDRADRLREAIDREGVTITSARSKLPRAHPALRLRVRCGGGFWPLGALLI